MGRYVKEMKPMLTSMDNISVQTNIWDPDQTAPIGEQFNLDLHCLLQGLAWNHKLEEHKWRFAGVPMMAQQCWQSSFVIFQAILTSINKKSFISYDFSGGGVRSPCLPSGSAHEYAQLMLDPVINFCAPHLVELNSHI